MSGRMPYGRSAGLEGEAVDDTQHYDVSRLVSAPLRHLALRTRGSSTV